MPRRLITLVILGLVAAAPAWSQRGNRDEIDRLQAQRQDELARSSRLRADARAARREVERLRRELVELARAQSEGERIVSAQRLRLDALNARESALTVRMSRERVKMTRLLAALQLYSRDPPPALLVSPESATDAVRAAILMRAVTPELEARAAALAAEAAEIQRLRRQAALAGEALFTAESDVADRAAEIERLIAEKQSLETVLTADADAAEDAARALAERVRDLGGLVRGLAGADAPAAARGGTMPGGRTRLTTPVEGELVQGFGRGSEGLTWRTPAGAQVRAPADGAIDYAGPLEGYGEVIILRVGGGWRVVLAGLDQSFTATGRRVAEGEPIGRMGGDDDEGGRIYMELRRDQDPVNPSPWLDGGGGG